MPMFRYVGATANEGHGAPDAIRIEFVDSEGNVTREFCTNPGRVRVCRVGEHAGHVVQAECRRGATIIDVPASDFCTARSFVLARHLDGTLLYQQIGGPP